MRLLLFACVAAAVLFGAGCETTQEKSARLAREGADKAKTGKLDLAAQTNRSVRAGKPVVLAGDGVNAVVVPLENTGSSRQAGIPIALDARDAAGRSIYKNDLDGLQTSLQQMASLEPGAKAYWVDDQVTSGAVPKSVKIAVGTPAAANASAPGLDTKLKLEGVGMKDDVAGSYLGGIVRNPGKVALKKVPVYAVGLKGDRVVAAGRSIVEQVDPEPVKKPAVFRIFFLGDPKGADIDVNAYPAPPAPTEEGPGS